LLDRNIAWHGMAWNGREKCGLAWSLEFGVWRDLGIVEQGSASLNFA
jgi:hypothetical protein